MVKVYHKDVWPQNLQRVCLVGVECVSALAIDQILQMNLLQAGILWHLLLFLFSYDYTLDEGGVSKSEKTNQQVGSVARVLFIIGYDLCQTKLK